MNRRDQEEESGEPERLEEKGDSDEMGECGVCGPEGGEQGCEDEGRVPRGLNDPKGPTRKEREEHELTHIPYRSWCEFCVKGRGRRSPHKTKKAGEKEESNELVAKVHMDFYYNGGVGDDGEDDEAEENGEEDEGRGSDSPALVLYDEKTKAHASWLMSSKSVVEGGPDDWVPKAVADELEAWGYANRKIIVGSDGEPAMVALKEKVIALRKAETVPEESPVGEHQANLAEGAVRRVREQTRTILGVIEGKCGAKVKRDAPVMEWLVRWAGMMISRFQVGEDGKTAHERIRGRKCNTPVAICGEKVLYRELEDGRGERAKIETKWMDGVWLGIKNRTGEHVIGTPEGIVKAHSVKRRAAEERWDIEAVNAVKGTPGRPKPGRRDMRIPVRVRFPEVDQEGVVDAEEPRARRMYIKRKDYEDHRFTTREEHGIHCEGCRRMMERRSARPHAKGCIERMKKCILESTAGQARQAAADDRMNDAIARRMEQDLGDAAERQEECMQVEEEIGAADEENDEMASEEHDTDMVAMVRKLREAEEGVGGLMKMTVKPGGTDIVEIYSPERIVKVAEEHGLRGGWSLDLLTGWDFNKKADRDAAKRYVEIVKPTLVVGSPMCTAYSLLQKLNRGKSKEMDAKLDERRRNADMHMEFMMEVYKMQLDEGRYILHEHPLTAESWKLDSVKEILERSDMMTTVADQCEYGLQSKDRWGTAPAKKPTRFMTNSVMIAGELNTRCQNENRGDGERHRHIQLVKGRAKKAQE